MLALQVLLPLFKLTKHTRYCFAIFNELADLVFRWPRELALNAVAHSCINGGGGVGV